MLKKILISGILASLTVSCSANTLTTPVMTTTQNQAAFTATSTNTTDAIFTESYMKTLKGGISQDKYDSDKFLESKLGMKDVVTGGRTNEQFRLELLSNDYTPTNTLFGKKIFIQQWFFQLTKKNPKVYDIIAKPISGFINLFSQLKHKWEKEYNGDLKVATDRFAEDVHYGKEYGSYFIAQQIGFTDEEADRIAKADQSIDEKWGTKPSLMGAIDRHFNLNPLGKEDTRLIWADKHLSLAISLMQKGKNEDAQTELGYGLHSLQDLFSHGQITSAMHATIGYFPDEVKYNAASLAEATAATYAYLSKYYEKTQK